MKAELLSFTDALRHLFFPRRCAVCAALVPGLSPKTPICEGCRTAWRAELLSRCPMCGQAEMQCRCAPIIGGDTLFTPGCAELCFYHLLPYRPGKRESVAASILLRLKDHRDRDAIQFLAGQLTPLCQQAIYENTAAGKREDWILTYVPRSRKKAAASGIDQAKLLSSALARQVQIPFQALFLRKPGQNTAQKTLDRTARLQNAEKSYQLLPGVDVRGKRILIFDDILTTGATLYTAAELLRSAGAACCVCLTVARTTDKRHTDPTPRNQNHVN